MFIEICFLCMEFVVLFFGLFVLVFNVLCFVLFWFDFDFCLLVFFFILLLWVDFDEFLWDIVDLFLLFRIIFCLLVLFYVVLLFLIIFDLENFIGFCCLLFDFSRFIVVWGIGWWILDVIFLLVILFIFVLGVFDIEIFIFLDLFL